MLFTRRKPEWLYRSLPSIYAISGIAILLARAGRLAFLSGALLLAAAALSTWMRRHHQALRHAAVPSVLGERPRAPSAAARHAERLRGLAAPPCHPELDRQHRLLAL